MHERDRADAAHRLRDRGLRLGRRQPPALQAQQRRDRLQVVLHPVVDLADRRVLRQQQPVAAAQLGDVAERARTAPVTVAVGRAAGCSAIEHGDLGAALDLLGDRARAVANAVRTSASSKPSSPRRMPSALACTPMRCSADTAFGDVYSTRPTGVEDDHAVADARRLLGLARPGRRTGTRRRRSSGRSGRRSRSRCARARRAAARTSATDSRVSTPTTSPRAAHRDAQRAHPLLQRRAIGDLALDDLAEAQRPGDERPLASSTTVPTSRPGTRLPGRGPDLAEHEEPAPSPSAVGREQQQVGEAEVGEQPPLGDQALEVADLAASERVWCRASSARVAIGHDATSRVWVNAPSLTR